MASGFTDTVDGFLLDEDAARIERMRLVDVERQRQETKEAEIELQSALVKLDIAREVTLGKVADADKAAARVDLVEAQGNKAIADANAENIRLFGRAGYKAIQRQGHLLAMSHLQYLFFGGLVGAGLIVGGLGVLVWYADKIVKKGTK
jgi:alpha-galactosidase/6-phospho-beta-glucosidase family protein